MNFVPPFFSSRCSFPTFRNLTTRGNAVAAVAALRQSRRARPWRALILSSATLLFASVGSSQPSDSDNMAMMMLMAEPFAGVPEARLSSGTSWQPDTTPMHAIHYMLGDWMVMLHYNAFLNFDKQLGWRGGQQIDSQNWAMLMATRRWAGQELLLRGMFSLEPWTVTKHGYPLLFQTGESYNGQPLVDRQHPHDFFMELAVRYRRALDRATAASLYVAPSGEPALGPTAFMHRTSAMDMPTSPITHHWMDSTHIAFGVLTAGVSSHDFQLEGSFFNGREPDQNRWDIEPPHLDSYSGRLSWNPAREWSAQVSYGYLASPEELHPEESEHRSTASVSYTRPLDNGRVWATTLGFGQDLVEQVRSNGWLAETDFQITSRLTLFGRGEQVQKTGEELNIGPAQHRYQIQQLSIGATWELLPSSASQQLAFGAEVTRSWAPSSLNAFYGENPLGYWIFFRVRPKLAVMHHMGM